MANFQGKEKAVMKVGLVTSPVLPDVLALSFPNLLCDSHLPTSSSSRGLPSPPQVFKPTLTVTPTDAEDVSF